MTGSAEPLEPLSMIYSNFKPNITGMDLLLMDDPKYNCYLCAHRGSSREALEHALAQREFNGLGNLPG